MKNGNLLVVLFGLLLLPAGSASACDMHEGLESARDSQVAVLGTVLGDLSRFNGPPVSVRVDKVAWGKHPGKTVRIDPSHDAYCSDAPSRRTGDRIIVYLRDGPDHGVIYWHRVDYALEYDKRITGKLCRFASICAVEEAMLSAASQLAIFFRCVGRKPTTPQEASEAGCFYG
jgi:hypothetical protein